MAADKNNDHHQANKKTSQQESAKDSDLITSQNKVIVTDFANNEQLKTSTAMKSAFSPISNKKVGFYSDQNIIDV